MHMYIYNYDSNVSTVDFMKLMPRSDRTFAAKVKLLKIFRTRLKAYAVHIARKQLSKENLISLTFVLARMLKSLCVVPIYI